MLDIMARHRLPPTAETYEFVGNAFVKEVTLEATATSMARLPDSSPPEMIAADGTLHGGDVGKQELPEVVFIGRSNVGKSSLVNMLCGRNALASTSAEPEEAILLLPSQRAGRTSHLLLFGGWRGHLSAAPSSPSSSPQPSSLTGVPEFALSTSLAWVLRRKRWPWGSESHGGLCWNDT